MNSNNSIPPTVDAGVMGHAMALLAAVSDVQGTRKRLQQLADGQAALAEAQRAHDAAADRARQAATDLADLRQLQSQMADRAAELDQRATQLDVAAGAHAARQKNLDERERAIGAQAADLQRRTAAFDARVKTFRDQLAS
jgi:chromosome segregation ATPase